MAMELNILNPADVGAAVNKYPPPQNATVNAPDAVPHVAFRADPNAVIAINQGKIFEGIVVALKMCGPGVGMNIGHALLRIIDSHPPHRRGMAQLEKSRALLGIAAARGKDNRAIQRFAPHRRFSDTLQDGSGRNPETAFDQVMTRWQPNAAPARPSLIQCALNRRRVIGHAIGFGAA